MLFYRRFLIGTALITAGFLSACGISSQTVVSRSSQVEYFLSDRVDECLYQAITNDLKDELQSTTEGTEMLEQLDELCPEMTTAFVDSSQKRWIFPNLSQNDGGSPDVVSEQANGVTVAVKDASSSAAAPESQTGGDKSSNGKNGNKGGHGSKSNNGSGNGSEGRSPSRSERANDDE